MAISHDYAKSLVYKYLTELGHTPIEDIRERLIFCNVALHWITRGNTRLPQRNSIQMYVNQTYYLYMKVLIDTSVKDISYNPRDRIQNFTVRMKEVKRRIEQTWVEVAKYKASLMAR